MVVSAFCTLFLGCTKQKRIAQEEPQRTVRIAIQPSAAFMPLYIARYAGFIDEALAQKNASVIWQDFESGPPIQDSLDEALLKKVASELKITVEQMQRIAKKYQFSVEITQADIDSLQDTANFLVSIGTLSQSPHIADYVDTSCFSRN